MTLHCGTFSQPLRALFEDHKVSLSHLASVLGFSLTFYQHRRCWPTRQTNGKHNQESNLKLSCVTVKNRGMDGKTSGIDWSGRRCCEALVA